MKESERERHEREERAGRLRPQVEEKARKARSRRQAAGEIGVSNTALARFLDGETPYTPTLDLYEAWVTGRRESVTSARRDELARQIEVVLSLPGEWLEKSYFMESVAASYRARAMDLAEERALLREQNQTHPQLPGEIPPSAEEGGEEEAA